MSATAIILAAFTIGIEVGWQPLADGGHEYTIQIEPQVLDLLRRGGNEVFSEVPPDVDVRRFRLVAGNGKLPRVTATPGLAALPPRPGAAQSEPHRQDSDDPLRLPAATSEASDRPNDEALPAAAQLGQGSLVPPSLDAADDARAESVRAAKPASESGTPPAGSEPSRPWMAFVTALVILCCSLGANIYLGWSTWDARNRYRAALTKAHAAATS